MASPLTTGATGLLAATLQAATSGDADLDRLLMVAAPVTIAAGLPLDLLPILRVRSLLVQSELEMIRGSGTVSGPGGSFSPLRLYSPIQLGRQAMESKDVIDLSAFAAPGVNWGLSFAVPFVPSSKARARASRFVQPGTPHRYVASTEASAVPTGTITMTFDASGVVDLDSLQLLGTCTPPVDNFGQELLAATVLTSITLPTGDQLILGSGGTPAVPANTFAFGRDRNWVHFGQFQVSNGEAITIGYNYFGDAAVAGEIFSAGCRFYPSARR